MWRSFWHSLGQGIQGQCRASLQTLRGYTRALSQAGPWAWGCPLGLWLASLGSRLLCM